MKVKSGQPLMDVLKVTYNADQPVLLLGKHGIGKSQIVEQAAQIMGIESIVLDLSIMENVDLLGLPQVVEGRMSYAQPSFLPTGGKGLLVFEELNRCPRYMQAPCLQLLTARRLNSYILPKGWLPCACVNPVGEGYTTDELDLALQSRFLTVELVPDLQEWLGWAARSGIDQRVREFVSVTPKIFESDKSNPRAWSYVSKMLQSVEAMNGTEETLLASITGLVGDELGLAFINYSKGSEKPLAADAIIERYDKDAVRETALRWKASGKIDLLKSSLHKLEVCIQSLSNWEEAVAKAPEQRKNVERFIKDLPAELRRQAQEFMSSRGYHQKVVA